MTWTVLSPPPQSGRIRLISSSDTDGMLPIGSFLTVTSGDVKHILRVEQTIQEMPYQPSPLLIDLDLSPLEQDLKSQNIVIAYRVADKTKREDGLIDFVKPLSKAERSTAQEIEEALEQNNIKGPRVFVSTVYSGRNQVLKDYNGDLVSVKIPEEAFYYQMMISGKTGSGKTAAMKYFAQYFVEELGGCVLAVNVKDNDLLRMNKPSKIESSDILNEWKSINIEPHGIKNFSVYYPAISEVPKTEIKNSSVYQKVTMDLKRIEPEALMGILENVSDIAAQNLPAIFRYWRYKQQEGGKEITMKNFTNYIAGRRKEKEKTYPAKNVRGEIVDEIPLHSGTIDNILRNLNYASDFFDNDQSRSLTGSDILQAGKISVINIADVKYGVTFGAILLRDLLHQIVDLKKAGDYTLPVLIIIDEVHQFYGNNSSREALGDLDTISRTGRSSKIGVIFASQNTQDLPKGLSNVVNTKFMFRSDGTEITSKLIQLDREEMAGLAQGHCAAIVYGIPQIRMMKFPLAEAGIFKNGDEIDE